MTGEEEEEGPVALTEQEMEQVTGGLVQTHKGGNFGPWGKPGTASTPFALVLVEIKLAAETAFAEWLTTHPHP